MAIMVPEAGQGPPREPHACQRRAGRGFEKIGEYPLGACQKVPMSVKSVKNILTIVKF
jgi:hypothetical protein